MLTSYFQQARVHSKPASAASTTSHAALGRLSPKSQAQGLDPQEVVPTGAHIFARSPHGRTGLSGTSPLVHRSPAAAPREGCAVRGEKYRGHGNLCQPPGKGHYLCLALRRECLGTASEPPGTASRRTASGLPSTTPGLPGGSPELPPNSLQTVCRRQSIR